MKKSLKTSLKVIGLILAFIICSCVVLVFLLDANMFKPRIEAIAKQQGIALTMGGDLHWAYWPALGLAVHEVSVADADAPEKIIAEIKKASFLVAFFPLMRGDVQVKHILIDGADIHLSVNEQGVGNWEKLAKAKSTSAQPSVKKTSDDSQKTFDGVKQAVDTEVPVQITSENLKLAIEKISLKHSNIDYLDLASGMQLALKNILLDVDDFNTQNKPFAMEFAWDAQIHLSKDAHDTFIISSRLKQHVQVDESFNAVAFTNGQLDIDVQAQASAKATAKYSLNVNDLKKHMQYKGMLQLEGVDAKQWLLTFGVPLKTANDHALSSINVKTDFSGDKNQIAFSGLNLAIDNTHLTGTGSLQFSSAATVLHLQGDELALSDYLPPPVVPVKKEAVPVENKSVAEVPSKLVKNTVPTAPDIQLPMDALRKLNSDITLGLKKILFAGLVAENVQVDISAKNGTLQQQLSASAYKGNIHTTADLDVRGSQAQLQSTAVVQGLDIAPLLHDKKLDKNVKLEGVLQANARSQANGVSVNQLFESLVGNINFSGEKMRLSPINLEQQFCKVVALVNRTEAPSTQWEEATPLRNLSGKANIAHRMIVIDNMSAGVEKLQLNANGSINLVDGGYDILLPLSVQRDTSDSATSVATSAHGCTLGSRYWFERSMSLLRCRGAYADINPLHDCRPDKDGLASLTKDYAAFALREKYGEKVDSKKAELQKKLDEKLGGDGAEKAKKLLKNLFKKNNDS